MIQSIRNQIFNCAKDPNDKGTGISCMVPAFHSLWVAKGSLSLVLTHKVLCPMQTQSEDEAIFIVIVIINPLIKVSFIHVNIHPLSPLPPF